MAPLGCHCGGCANCHQHALFLEKNIRRPSQRLPHCHRKERRHCVRFLRMHFDCGLSRQHCRCRPSRVSFFHDRPASRETPLQRHERRQHRARGVRPLHDEHAVARRVGQYRFRCDARQGHARVALSRESEERTRFVMFRQAFAKKRKTEEFIRNSLHCSRNLVSLRVNFPQIAENLNFRKFKNK